MSRNASPQVLRFAGVLYRRAKDTTPSADDAHRLKYEILPELLWRGKKKVNYSDQAWNWLQGLSASEAFVYAMAEGPWKQDRIAKVRGRMLAILGKRDLGSLSTHEIEAMHMPLAWQKSRVQNLALYLQRTGQSMGDFLRNLKSVPPMKAVTILYGVLGSKSRTKTIDLFLRDFVCADVVPIDRHVRRVLKKFGLPAKEDYLIKLAYRINMRPRFFARLLIAYAFTGKPFMSPVRKGL